MKVRNFCGLLAEEVRRLSQTFQKDKERGGTSYATILNKFLMKLLNSQWIVENDKKESWKLQ